MPAADQQYTKGLSLWKHRIIKTFVQAEKNEVNIEALAAAKAKIQQIVADEYIQTRRNKGRKTAARLLDINPTSPTINAPSNIQTLPAAAVQWDQECKVGEAPAHTKVDTVKTNAAIEPDNFPQECQNDLSKLDMTGWGGDYDLPIGKEGK